MTTETPAGFPLSPQQRRTWILQRRHGEDEKAGAWHGYLHGRITLHGPLDEARLRGALATLVERYEILRTRLRQFAGMSQPLQALGTGGVAWRSVGAQPVARNDGAVLEAELEPLGDQQYELRLRLPAVLADAESFGVLSAELAALYAGDPAAPASTGEEDGDGDEEPLQYADLADWLNELQRAEENEAGRVFWRRYLSGLNPLARLPFAGRPPVQATAEVPYRVTSARPCSRRAAERLRELSRAWDVDADRLHQLAWMLLLGRLDADAAAGDAVTVVVATAFDGRAYEGLEGAVGPLARYLPVRLELPPEASPDTLAKTLAQTVAELREVQELFPWFQIDAPEFGAGFLAVSAPAPIDASRVRFEPAPADWHGEPFTLLLRLQRKAPAAQTVPMVRLESHHGLDASDLGRTLEQFLVLLDGLADAPRTPWTRLPLLAAVARQQLLYEFAADPWREETREATVASELQARCAEVPDAVAVVYEQQRLSYRELERRARCLAVRLQQAGVGPESVVALALERSADLIVALTGVLWAGAAYLPLDPTLPRPRRDLLLDEAGAAVLVVTPGEPTEEVIGDDRPRLPVRMAVRLAVRSAVPLAAPLAEERFGDSRLDRWPALPSAAAYVLFTSGSTGRPKGVVVEHQQLLAYARAAVARLALPPGASYATVSTFAADLGNTVIFPSLLTGGCLHIVAERRLADPRRLAHYMERQAVDCLKIVPGHLRALLSVPRPARLLPRQRLVLGGEGANRDWVEEVRRLAPTCTVLNHYGPTETTVGVLASVVTSGGPWQPAILALGRPLRGARLFVTDHQLRLLPPWVAGELVIGGSSVSRGYLGCPVLTATSFLPDPFAAGRLYRSGDRVRCRPDGVFEFLGRVDDQVKIRGFRIEPGEVEAVLRRHPQIADAAVMVREDSLGQPRLVAYTVLGSQADADPEAIDVFLRQQLPEFMLPAATVDLPSLPRTANGKLDRRRLPMAEQIRRAEYVAPRTDLERSLVAIWRDVLGVERLGIRDNFFRLGGDSIRSITLAGKALESGLEIPVALLFRYPTIEDLAPQLEGAGTAPGTGTLAEEPSGAAFSLLAPRDRRRLPAAVEDAYPLGYLQAGMVFHSDLRQGSALYHDLHTFHLELQLDLAHFRAAVQALAERHAALRTGFELSGYSEALQLVYRRVTVPITVIDLGRLTAVQRQAVVANWLQRERRRPLDWRRPPLMHFFCHLLGEGQVQFTMSFHHAIVDGWSSALLTTELFRDYLARVQGRPPATAAPEVRYRDFIALERRTLDDPDSRHYWQQRLGERPDGRLPRWQIADLQAPPEARNRVLDVTAEVSQGLKALADDSGVPVRTVLLAVHLRALSWLTGRRRVITGLVSNGRPEVAGGEQVVGLHLNVPPLCLTLPTTGWRGLIAAVLRAEQDLMPHRRFPLAELQRRFGGGEPLFETEFNYVNYHVYQGLQRDLQASEELESKTAGAQSGGQPGGQPRLLGQGGYEETNFPLAVNFSLDLFSSEVRSWIVYRADELPALQVERIASLYQQLLRAAADGQEAGAAAPLCAGERHQLRHEWSGTALAPPASELSWHHRFEAQVAREPDAVAVVYGRSWLSYRQLDHRSGRLARMLRQGLTRSRPVSGEQKVLFSGEEPVVAVLLERSVDLVMALVAVLKAGAAYLPLDAEQPAERLAFQLRDAGAGQVVTTTRLATTLPEQPVVERCLIDLPETFGDALAAKPGPAVDARRLAYIIYTSGSTGWPKGVEVEHRSPYVLLCALQAVVPAMREPASRLRASLNAPYVFDASMQQLVQLLVGHTLEIVPASLRNDGSALRAFLARRALDIYECTPSQLRLLVAAGLGHDGQPAPGTVTCAGEAVDPALWRQLADSTIDAFNLYGPTEATVDATGTRMTGSRPSIGRPLPGYEAWVLDALLEPVLPAVPSQLFLGGGGLARGYRCRPALTAQAFVPHPCAERGGDRLYATGDLARFRVDGALEFLGRLDAQVKLRGFRIELGEIEAALAELSSVHRAAVLLEEGPEQDHRILAFVVSRDGRPLAAPELRAALSGRLPAYMLPAVLVALEELPLTVNGKLDRAALLAAAAAEPQPVEPASVPRTPEEELIAGIWCEVLQRSAVGVDQDFFDLGGHSLLATQVIVRLRDAFQVELPMARLFAAPTVAGLAAAVLDLRRAGLVAALPPLQPVVRQAEGLPLSFAQQRLWFTDRLESSGGYNIAVALRLKGDLQPRLLHASLATLVRRHEVLRTSFQLLGDEPVQVIAPPGPVPLPRVDLGGLGERALEVAALLAPREAVRPFDLQRSVLRMTLLRLGEGDHALLFTLHHIAGDGWSIGLLMRELTELYQAGLAGHSARLPELPLQYADFAVWQRAWLQGAALDRQLDYWRRRLAGWEPPELPSDYAAQDAPARRAERLVQHAEPPVLAALEELARRESATLFMVLTAALGLLISHLTHGDSTHGDNVAIGTDVANRGHAGIEGIFGFFINQLVLRLDLGGEHGFHELLRRVRARTLEAYGHQDLPYERLVEELGRPRRSGRTRLFDAKLVLQNTPEQELDLPGLELGLLPIRGERPPKFELLFNVHTDRLGLHAVVEFASDRFRRSTVEHWARQWFHLLERIAAEPEITLPELRDKLQQEDHERRQAQHAANRQSGRGRLRGARRQEIEVDGA